jgi:HEPN domain-containing protein
MSPRIFETAAEWLKRAHSNFARILVEKPEEVYFEDLCFDAQQAAEKALKAIFVLHGKRFPLTHDLGELIENLEAFLPEIPTGVRNCVQLNDYAVLTRYPGFGSRVTEEEFHEAVCRAREVITFADSHFATVVKAGAAL